MTSFRTFFTKGASYFWVFNQLSKKSGRRKLRERISIRIGILTYYKIGVLEKYECVKKTVDELL